MLANYNNVMTGLLPAAKQCRKAEPPPLRAGSFTLFDPKKDLISINYKIKLIKRHAETYFSRNEAALIFIPAYQYFTCSISKILKR